MVCVGYELKEVPVAGLGKRSLKNFDRKAGEIAKVYLEEVERPPCDPGYDPTKGQTEVCGWNTGAGCSWDSPAQGDRK
jgi:hypothetical protein